MESLWTRESIWNDFVKKKKDGGKRNLKEETLGSGT